MPLTREEVFALIDEKIFTNNSAQIQAADVNALLKTIYDNAPNTGFEHYIGEAFGGGVIFHLWKDSEGVEHGLVVDTIDLSAGHLWSWVNTAIGSSARSTWDGLTNSNAIVAQSGHSISAAKLCLDSTNNGFNDWYLPAPNELLILLNINFNISKSLSNIGGSPLSYNSIYWTSFEFTADHSVAYSTSDIFSSNNTKQANYRVRAIRQF